MKRQADIEVSMAVNMIRMCQATHSLPAVGGLLDQDAYFVFLLQVVLNADEKKTELERAKQNVRSS